MKAGSLFSGYGGLDMAAATVLGTDTVWHCELDLPASRILAHHWPHVPNLGDITTVDWTQVEPVDVLLGGFPCQDVSAAGKRAGLRPGTRSGLWQHMAYAITQLRPALVVVENVRGLLSAEAHSDMEPCPWCVGDGEGEPSLRALGAVLGDLAVLGYDARWAGVRAADAGAPHARFRVFVIARDTNRSDSDRRPAAGLARQAGPTPRPAEVATDTGRGELQRRGGPGGVARPPRGDQGEGHQRKRHGHTAVYGGADAADAYVKGPQGRKPTAGHDVSAWGAAPDTRHDGREGRAERHVGPEGRQPAPLGADVDGLALGVDWREYGPAIRQWERILGRPAPCPHEPNSKGGRRLNPWFVEWLMGLPSGHVCGVTGITRNDQLRALGNGVVPQQGALGLWLMRDFWQPVLDTREAVPA